MSEHPPVLLIPEFAEQKTGRSAEAVQPREEPAKLSRLGSACFLPAVDFELKSPYHEAPSPHTLSEITI